jgi:hypothetical protein
MLQFLPDFIVVSSEGPGTYNGRNVASDFRVFTLKMSTFCKVNWMLFEEDGGFDSTRVPVPISCLELS